MPITPKHIIISRTDSIGDVILTLPMASYLKTLFPSCKISFLGRNYTKDVIACCKDVDAFLSFDTFLELSERDAIQQLKNVNADVFIHVFPRKELARWAKKAQITYRIGTSHRLYHLNSCNKRVSFSRKKSNLHESQLNLKLLAPLGFHGTPDLMEIGQKLKFSPSLEKSEKVNSILHPDKKNIILHPKSQGSAVEWGLKNFSSLCVELDKQGFYPIFTGTKNEGILVGKEIKLAQLPAKTTFGELSLSELILLISKSDALIAASTGPLHIAGALNIKALGLFSPRKPIHPGRWMPLGGESKALVYNHHCEKCSKNKPCNCIRKITVEQVIQELQTKNPTH